MNKPDDFDCWRMPDDDTPKVQIIIDTKVPSAAMFIVQREDHTLGHMMRTCVVHLHPLARVRASPRLQLD